MASRKNCKSDNKCPHLEKLNYSVKDIFNFRLEKSAHKCNRCNHRGPNLWICLHENCLEIGCSEKANDHSTLHFHVTKKMKTIHSVHMNLSSQRVWCYLCDSEVFLNQKVHDVDSEIRNQSVDEDSESLQGLVGLQNIANTCYMNAALQALCHIPELTRYFLDFGEMIDNYPGDAKKLALSRAYCNFMKEVWWSNESKNIRCVIPRGVLYNIRTVYPMFKGFQQHDSQEFLRCFMDQLHEELKESFPMASTPSYSISRSESNNLDRQSICSSISPSQSEAEYETCDSGVSEPSSLFDEAFKCKTATNSTPASPGPKSIISDVFDGKLLSSVQCLTCDRVSCKEETFQDLSLPIPNKDHLAVLHKSQPMITGPISHHGGIPNPISLTQSLYKLNTESWFWWIWNLVRSWFWGPSISLQDCLTSFFSDDELKGDNMYSCDKCKKLRNGIKYSRVVDLPEILCVHLKRFRHDLSFSSKISSNINFPLTDLDMKPFMQKSEVSDASRNDSTIYNLTSVICHHGTVGGGHYTSFAKHEASGKWFEFDDHHVSEVSSETVQSCQAYVLFYRKHNPSMERMISEAQFLLETSSVTECSSEQRFFVSRQWIHRFNTFANPGPINNWSLLCQHGDVHPKKMDSIDCTAMPLPKQLWEFLHRKFGGGPIIQNLSECEICKRIQMKLHRRQMYEWKAFQSYNNEFQLEEEEEEENGGAFSGNGAIYAISISWFRKWESFVRAWSEDEPGPIDNKPIAVFNNEGVPKRNHVRVGSNYAQLNSTLWNFFYNIYGGGPEICLREPLYKEEAVFTPKEGFDYLPTSKTNNRKHPLANGLPSDDEEDEELYIKKSNSETDKPKQEIEKEAIESINQSSVDIGNSEEHCDDPALAAGTDKEKKTIKSISKKQKRLNKLLQPVSHENAKQPYNNNASKTKKNKKQKATNNAEKTTNGHSDIIPGYRPVTEEFFGPSGKYAEKKLQSTPLENGDSKVLFKGNVSTSFNRKKMKSKNGRKSNSTTYTLSNGAGKILENGGGNRSDSSC